MKRYNIFVILWAIYNSKRTKTPWDIEQIHITTNRVKNDKLFPCLAPFSPVLSQTCTHAQKLVVIAALEFINKIVSQLKSYMTFLSSEVLEAVQLKDSLLVDTAVIHTRLIYLSLSNNCISMAQASVINYKMTFWNLQQKVWDEVRIKWVQHTRDFRMEAWQMSWNKSSWCVIVTPGR